jgi:uncharacterized membrane protein
VRAVAVQLVVAVCALVGGAWLVGVWMVGVVVMLLGVAVGVNAFLTDPDRPREQKSALPADHPIERFRRMR